ncbi:MAG TPA: SDR family oxidoreductase [Archangium sp.]|uniref:SDR family oxidoreductase n=1 Tax=Archangium sp. TaxID=1872627 RepID=UPI002ED81054
MDERGGGAPSGAAGDEGAALGPLLTISQWAARGADGAGEDREQRGGRARHPEEKITSQIPARRLGKPEELGALVTFLASEQAAYITGQSIAIDGGWMRGF